MVFSVLIHSYKLVIL